MQLYQPRSLQTPNPCFLFLTNSPQYTYFLGSHSSPSPCLNPSSRYSDCHPPRYLLPSQCQIKQMFRATIIVQFVYFLMTKFSYGILNSQNMFLAVSQRSYLSWSLNINFQINILGILTTSLKEESCLLFMQRSLRQDREDLQDISSSGIFEQAARLRLCFWCFAEASDYYDESDLQLYYYSDSSFFAGPFFVLTTEFISSLSLYRLSGQNFRSSLLLPYLFLIAAKRLFIFPQLPPSDCCFLLND